MRNREENIQDINDEYDDKDKVILNHYGDLVSLDYCDVEGSICKDAEEELGEEWDFTDFTGCEEWYGYTCRCAYITYKNSLGNERTLIIQYEIVKITKDEKHFDFSYEWEEEE